MTEYTGLLSVAAVNSSFFYLRTEPDQMPKRHAVCGTPDDRLGQESHGTK